jgi:hypothetical protein
MERREVWFVPAVELAPYIQQEWWWKNLRLVGVIRCSRRRTRDSQRRNQEMTTWGCSRDPSKITLDQVANALRQHWTVENGIFYVRDVSYSEDRSHARLVGVIMSTIRNLAISIIRKAAYPFRPMLGLRYPTALILAFLFCVYDSVGKPCRLAGWFFAVATGMPSSAHENGRTLEVFYKVSFGEWPSIKASHQLLAFRSTGWFSNSWTLRWPDSTC